MTDGADIPVVIAGANGRMGRETIRAVLQQVDLTLVAALGRSREIGQDVGTLTCSEPCGILLEDDPAVAIPKATGGVLIDFSLGSSVKEHVLLALRHDISCVVGVTAIPPADEQEMIAAATTNAVLVANNFAMGAVLMMKFAREASQYFRWAEIIEMHHEKKLDAPSGTARRTAEAMRKARPDGFRSPIDAEENIKGVRGGSLGGIRIHSVRLPGLQAHQEVILAAPGETLTIRHDAWALESYMPGVLLAARKIRDMTGYTIGLENVLE